MAVASADLLPAIFGLAGVVVGGLLNGGLAAWAERRRAFRDGVVAARLVQHELELVCAEVSAWHRESRMDPESLPLAHEVWDKNRAVLARTLHYVDWEMVNAGYTWVELINRDHRPEEEWTPGVADFYDSVIAEMTGGVKALKPLATGYRRRVSPRLRWIVWRQMRRETDE